MIRHLSSVLNEQHRDWTAFFAYFTYRRIKRQVGFLILGMVCDLCIYLIPFDSTRVAENIPNLYIFFTFIFFRSIEHFIVCGVFVCFFFLLFLLSYRYVRAMCMLNGRLLLLFPFFGPLCTLWLLYMNLIVVPIVFIFFFLCTLIFAYFESVMGKRSRSAKG